MGIVNLTDDSFYSESRVLSSEGLVDKDLLLRKVAVMLSSGADILDLGACSTRPGSRGVGPEQEWRRLEPALRTLRDAFPEARLSVDTYWSEVVQRCYDVWGPFMVNDISAGLIDPKMLRVVGSLGLPYVAMHMHGTPEDMQSRTSYPKGVVADEIDYFTEFSRRASASRVKDWTLDPGFGFSKTLEQNYELLRALGDLKCFDRPILVGVSRKSMIYKPLGITAEESLSSTQVIQYEAIRRGAGILRVHDVKEAKHTAILAELCLPEIQ